MSNKRTKLDHFAFDTIVGSPALERNIPGEILSSLTTQQQAKDLIEQQLGIKATSANVPLTKIRTKIFKPGHSAEEDKKLELLLNSSQYKVMYWKDNWSDRGGYQIFVIFSEQIEEPNPNGNQQDSK